MYAMEVLTKHHSLKGLSLKMAPTVRTVLGTTFQGQGRGKEPPVAWVQLRGQQVVMSSPPLLTVLGWKWWSGTRWSMQFDQTGIHSGTCRYFWSSESRPHKLLQWWHSFLLTWRLWVWQALTTMFCHISAILCAKQPFRYLDNMLFRYMDNFGNGEIT